MSDEEIVKAKWPDALVKWKQGEQHLCQIIDWRGNILGQIKWNAGTPYPEVESKAWTDAAKRLAAQP